MRSFTPILVLFLLPSILIGQDFDPRPSSTTDRVVKHSHYSLSYSEEHEQAEWVSYELEAGDLRGDRFERTDDFRKDPDVETGSASLEDHHGDGYDRGHLAPAADMAHSPTAISESFYMSNMSPQEASFNRGIWLSLEEQVRTWALRNDGVYVVTGPLLNGCKERVGPNRVCVPEHFYKVILERNGKESKMIALLLPNQEGGRALQEYVVTTDHLEEQSGIDFFPALADSMENELESQRNLKEWSFKDMDTEEGRERKNSSSQRCKGTTEDGDRCKRKTKDPSGYCWQHQ